LSHSVDLTSLQVDRRVRRAKTDRIDTVRLLRSLMAYLPGEPKVWSVCPALLKRTRVGSIVSGTVWSRNPFSTSTASKGFARSKAYYHPLRPQAARLEQLRTAQGIALPPRLKSDYEIKRELHRLTLVVEMIATLEAERDATVENETHVNAEKIQALHKLKAIGPEFATVLVGEIFYRDFNNRRQLASYVGYAPSPFQSGNVTQPRDQQGWQPQGANHRDRTRLALAAVSARQQFERLVPGACRCRESPYPPHRHRGVGTSYWWRYQGNRVKKSCGD
jgi:transposase